MNSAPFTGHIRTMRTLFSAALAAFALLFASGTYAPGQAQGPSGGAETAQIEQYINSIRTLQARFVQSNPNAKKYGF